MHYRNGLLLILLVLQSAMGFSQLMLENTQTQKIKSLKLGGEIKFTYDMDQSGMDYERILQGKLTAVESNKIRMLPEEEIQNIILDNGLVKTTTIDYEELIGLRPINIEIEGIQEVTYRGKSGQKLDATGKLLVALGGFSTMVVAPLASFNYNTLDFNNDRYTKVVVYSLAAIGVGVSILAFNRKKKYAIQANGQPADKKRWKIILK